MIRSNDPDTLIREARGGRVAHSGFLTPSESARLASRLRAAGVGVTAGGGFVGARRRVVTAHPEHVPEAQAAFAAVYLPGAEPAAVDDALRAAGVADAERGDVVAHLDGASVVVFDPPPEALARPLPVAGAAREPQRVPLERVAGGSRRSDRIIVPSLRVDALGAKAFRTSRAYFTKGVAAGNVYLNGERADKGSQAHAGDEIFADGLGWLRVREVTGETKKGNLKVTVEVERA